MTQTKPPDGRTDGFVDRDDAWLQFTVIYRGANPDGSSIVITYRMPRGEAKVGLSIVELAWQRIQDGLTIFRVGNRGGEEALFPAVLNPAAVEAIEVVHPHYG